MPLDHYGIALLGVMRAVLNVGVLQTHLFGDRQHTDLRREFEARLFHGVIGNAHEALAAFLLHGKAVDVL
ncbi:hypothetical protein D3C80_1629390 [compost metagenome]